MKSLQMMCVAVSALALAACGGGAKLGGGKQGAAQAAFQASQAGTKPSGGLLKLLEQNIGSFGSTVTVNGDHGGSASVQVTINTNGANTSITEQITYNNFSEDGQNRYNGTWNLTLNTSQTSITGGVSGAITMTMSGTINISGAIDDSITATNFSEALTYSNGSAGTAVTVTVNGQLATSTQSYTYTNEQFNLTANASLTAASK